MTSASAASSEALESRPRHPNRAFSWPFRGHGHSVSEAVSYLRKAPRFHLGARKREALEYRLKLLQRPSLQRLRELVGSATEVDFEALPSAEVLKGLPLRALRGRSLDGLPIIASVVRHVDFKELTKQDALEEGMGSIYSSYSYLEIV